MNILILNGSPRGENSATLKITKAFVKGIIQNGEHNEDYINVKDLKVHHCNGCFACWTVSPGKCVIEDDMTQLIEKYIEADVVIWSFPLYCFGMPSLIKAVLDRTLPTLHPELVKRDDGGYTHETRYDVSGKKTALISSCGFSSVKNNYEALTTQFEILYRGKCAKIYCPESGLLNVPELNGLIGNYLKMVTEAGKEFSQNGVFSSGTEAELSKVLYPEDLYNEAVNKNWKSKN